MGSCRNFVLPPWAVLLLLLGGCGTVPKAALQALDVEVVTPAGAPVVAAQCALSNDGGEWTMTAPGRTTVSSGAGPLLARCRTADGSGSGEASVAAQVRGGRGTRAWIGAGTGLLAGGVLGSASYTPDPQGMCCGRGTAAAAGAIFGSLLGAMIGAVSADL